MDLERGIDLTKTVVTQYETLTALRDEPQLSSRELGARLDRSRATVNRHLAALRERGLVSTTEGTHALTDFGSRIVEEVTEFSHQLQVESQLPDLATALSRCQVPFDSRLLSRATVTKPTSGEPYKMHDRYLGFWHETSRVRGARSVGAIPPDVVERVKPLLRGDVRVESVWTAPAARQYLETYPGVKRLWIEEPNARLLVTEESIPVQFGVFDNRLTFTVHDDATGHPRALVDTARPAAIEWASEMYAYYARRSQPLEVWLEMSSRPGVDGE